MASTKPKIKTCKYCQLEIAISRMDCPHCGRPRLFPNVDNAVDADEKIKLADRYSAVIAACHTRGTTQILNDFEAACRSSKAVFSLSVVRLHRQIASGTEIFASYYDLERLKNNTNSIDAINWAKVRPQAEIELLGDHHNLDQLHYAALSLEGKGLNYGPCFVTLADDKVAHRSSCFEGNTAVLYHKHHNFDNLVRSDWENRHEICVVMFGLQLTTNSCAGDFSSIIVQPAAKQIDDLFVEVHVFGPITIRTFDSVRFEKSKFKGHDANYLDSVIDKLKLNNIKTEVS